MLVVLEEELAAIPPFNEDLESAMGEGPEAVRRLRARAAAADGLLIATPEYNQSLPGVLKNAIDWLSRPGPGEALAGKPVAILGATSGPWGTRLAQRDLRHVLNATESRILPSPSLYVRDAGRLFDESGTLVDCTTRDRLAALLEALSAWIELVGPGRMREEAPLVRS